MADTINVPGIGATKPVYVYGAVALVVGIVGYAWWKNAQTPTDYVGASADDYGVGEYDSPLGDTGGNSTGSYTSVDPEAIDTNAEWTNDAATKLTNAGWNATDVYTALGKYLNRQGLTADQITIVQAAIAASGPPPVGGPYPITDSLPDTPSTGTGPPDAVENLRVFDTTANMVVLEWNRGDNVPPVGGYNIWWGGNVVKTQNNNAVIRGLQPKTSYTFEVEAYDPSDTVTSPRRSVSAKTK